MAQAAMQGEDAAEAKAEYMRQMQERQADAQIESIMRAVLDDEAKSRLSNVKLVNKELYLSAVKTIVYLYQAGNISGKMSDTQLKDILSKMSGGKREVSIRRK
jgi:programmed cell death protein 5